MTKTRSKRLLFAITFLLLGFAGSRVSAQSCSSDTDCPQGFACVANGTSTAPACKGTGCPEAAASDPVISKACQPKACASDADCGTGTGMICYEHKSTACSGSGGTAPGCAANTKCDAGPVITSVETCTTTTTKLCAFKWQLPCNADIDCGERFVCQPNVSGGCASSSRGVAVGAGGAASGGTSSSPPAADPQPPECQTTTSFPGSCRAKATTCTADSECPSGWNCTAVGTPEPVTGAGVPVSNRGDAPAAAAADSVDAGAAATKICIGPFGAGAPTRAATDNESGGQSTTGSSAQQGHDGPVSPPLSPGSGATGGTTGGAKATSGGGCAIGPTDAKGSSFLVLGLGAIGLMLSRRRRGK